MSDALAHGAACFQTVDRDETDTTGKPAGRTAFERKVLSHKIRLQAVVHNFGTGAVDVAFQPPLKLIHPSRQRGRPVRVASHGQEGCGGQERVGIMISAIGKAWEIAGQRLDPFSATRKFGSSGQNSGIAGSLFQHVARCSRIHETRL
nr:hypothetical protein [Neorhizobium tomejilense]